MAKGEFDSLVNRKVAIVISFFGLVEVLVGILIIICGFIMFGAFCENLSCAYISDGIGFWLGFPLLVPGILGLVVLGTRHSVSEELFTYRTSHVIFFLQYSKCLACAVAQKKKLSKDVDVKVQVVSFIVTNIIVLILSIVHTILAYNDYEDYWDQHNTWYNDAKCSPLGGSQCECVDGNIRRVLGYRCDLIEFGYDLNWILFGSSIAAIVLSLIAVIAGIVGRALITPAPRRS